MKIRIEVPLCPLAWAAPVVTKFGSFNKRKGYIRQVQYFVKKAYLMPILEGPILLEMEFFLPIPLSTSKKKQKLMNDREIPHIKKPDTSNMSKLHEDALQGIVFKNDSQVVSIRATKFYSSNPRSVIEVTTL